MTLIADPSTPRTGHHDGCPATGLPGRTPRRRAGKPVADGFGDASEEVLASFPEEGAEVVVLEEVEAPVVEEPDDAVANGALEDAVILEAKKVTGDGRDTTGLVLYQFWAELLEKAMERTRIHADVGPEREPVVGVGPGVAGLRYNYALGPPRTPSRTTSAACWSGGSKTPAHGASSTASTAYGRLPR